MKQQVYYTFEPSSDTLEIGSTYPQVQKMTPGYDYKAPNSIYALSRCWDRLPEFEPNLDGFVLHTKAKVTDVLSVATGYNGFLVSSRFKDILTGLKMPTHAFYKAKVFHKKQVYDYFWLHIICDLTSKINYKKSKFFVTLTYGYNIGHVEVESISDLEKKKKELQENNPDKSISIWSEKIVMNSDFQLSFDLFEIGRIDNNTYVSSKLKERILQNRISGILLKEQSKLTLT